MKRGLARKPEKAETLTHVTRFFLYLLIFLPAVFGLLYVRSFGVDVPYADTWKMVNLFEQWSSDTLSLSDLWVQHYEHRVLFPRIAMLLLGIATSFDNVAIMYLIQASFLATLIALLLAFRESTESKPSPRLLLFVPIAFLIFNPSQNWNMLQAWAVTFVFVQTFGVLAFYLLYTSGVKRRTAPAFLAAVASATVASFSSAQGLLVWPAGFLQLLIAPVDKPTKRYLVGVWGLVGLAEWVVYFLGWEAPARHSEGSYFLSNTNLGLNYFLAGLGGSLFRQPTIALVVGLALACLAAVSLLLVHRAGKLGECSLWVALLSFSLFFLASITVGRSGLGVENALHSKFVSFSVLAVIGIYSMLVKLALEGRSRIGAVSLAALFVLIAVSLPLSYIQGIHAAARIEMQRDELAFILATYQTQPNEILGKVHTVAARNKASVLEELEYGVFSKPQLQVLPPPLSALSPTEAVASAKRRSKIRSVSDHRVEREGQRLYLLKGQSYIMVTGRALDADGEGAAGGVYVEINNRLFPAYYHGLDEDGSARSSLPALVRFKFERAIPVTKIGGGTHELSIIIVTDGQKSYYRPDQEVTLEIIR
jgi:hypothetical protein